MGPVRVFLHYEIWGKIWQFSRFSLYRSLGLTNLQKIGDQIEEFLMLQLILEKILIDMASEKFYLLSKQVKKVKF